MWGLMSFIRAKTRIKSIEPTTYSTPHWDSRPSHAGGMRLSHHCVIFSPPLFSFIKAVTISSAESSLCCGETGERNKKESAHGTMGRGKKEERPPRLFPLPIVPRALSIFPLLLFLKGYRAEASAEEREAVIGSMSIESLHVAFTKNTCCGDFLRSDFSCHFRHELPRLRQTAVSFCLLCQ